MNFRSNAGGELISKVPKLTGSQIQRSVEAAVVQITGLVSASREKILQHANTELIDLYWRVGQYLSEQCKTAGWGRGTVQQLSDMIEKRHPDWRGFSKQNLRRMKQFYETYQNKENLSPLVRDLLFIK